MISGLLQFESDLPIVLSVRRTWLEGGWEIVFAKHMAE